MINYKKYKTRYPNLKYFFSAYFHPDWKYIYEWPTGEPSFQIVVNAFKDQASETMVSQTIQELEQLINEGLLEADLREVMLYLGSAVHAPGIGLTYRQWLEAILAILKDASV